MRPRNKLKTILFVIPSLDSGGAQRTILNVVNHLDRSRFKPVLTLYQRKGPLLNKVKEDVEVMSLEASRARFSIFGLRRIIRQIEPSLILSTIRYANAATVFAALLAGSRAPVVVRETNNFTAAGLSIHGFKERIVAWSYRHAQLVLALSEGVRQDVMKRYNIPNHRVRTIYNPIDIEEIRRLARLPRPELPDLNSDESGLFRLIAVGHLKVQKGFDLLIQAVSRLKDIPLSLTIVGNGPEELPLRELARSLGVADRVKFVGYQGNPYAWMARADLFVLSSRWEGFGHVIAEAMACGVPVLATRCPSGPDEIVSHGVNGSLCVPESVDSLVESIRTLWSDQEMRKQYAEKAGTMVERFDARSITREYEKIFETAQQKQVVLHRPIKTATKTILFVIPSLRSGGAERNFLNLANHIDRSKFRPILAVYQRNGALLQKLKDDVEVISLDASRARFSILSLRRTIHRLRPSVIFSTIRYANAATVLATLFAQCGIPVVISETNNFTVAGVPVMGVKERVVSWSYRHATMVVAPSEGVRRDVLARYSVPGKRVCTIYNPIDVEEIQRMVKCPLPTVPGVSFSEPDFFRILAVGHLKYQKGFDLLIQAVSRLNEIPLQLVIVGDGPKEDTLRQLIQNLDISDKVKLIGYQENPYAWMTRADLFVLSSRWEGFGHVITEAMACGVPVLATRCPSGPDEIVTDGVDGRLCDPDSVEALARGIREMWVDRERRKRYTENASRTVTRFDVRTITREYEKLLWM